ncbi:hypothetical protein [Umezawaea sp. NPDC059074]|uniref:hypothetical protein n=1 Tax=Umezawaea sp. NPDC059074 TaxID=3346716 RepID=UPI0036C0868D
MTRLLLVVLLLAGCGGPPDPRALSDTEAERLALVRFTNYTAKNARFTASVPSPGGTLLLTGRGGIGAPHGEPSRGTDGRVDGASTGLVQWNPARLAYHGADAPEPIDPAPTEGWQVRAMRRTGSELDGALRLLVDLAADRPENPQLLRQSTARWLRSDTVDGVAVDVLEGPAAGESRLRYWVDADGRLRRVEARLGDRQDYAVFDLRDGGAAITPIPPLA